MDEIWKEIPESDGKYFLVGYNKVYSKYKKDYLTERDNKGYGYRNIRLLINGKCIYRGIHFWVAYIYVPIPERLNGYSPFDLVVHHKDFNPRNNDPSNLEWMTDNEHRELHALYRGKTVYQYNIDGSFNAEYSSQKEAARAIGAVASNIYNCCNGKYKTAFGFQWRYEKYDRIPPVKSRYERIGEYHSKQVGQYDLDGNLIEIWTSIAEVQRQLGYSQGNISRCCIGKRPTAYGFVWKYA